MTIQILHRYSEAVLFEHDAANLRGANLRGANLEDADLEDADLEGADLRDVNFEGANLRGANLRGANLRGANFEGATLEGADLGGAYLRDVNFEGADLEGATLKNGEKLIGVRPIFQVGPVGSRSDVLVAYITDQGLRLDAGCQRQITREAFDARLSQAHSGNQHEREYRAALALIDVHAEIWTPT